MKDALPMLHSDDVEIQLEKAQQAPGIWAQIFKKSCLSANDGVISRIQARGLVWQ